MKRKIVFILTAIVLIVFTMIILVQATIQENSQDKILIGETLASIEDTHKKINEKGELSEEEIASLANTYINKVASRTTCAEDNNEINKIEYFENYLSSRKEAVVYVGSERIKLNANTGEFLSYHCSGIEGVKNKKTEEEIIKIANDILVQSALVNTEEYVLYELVEFDESIWRAWFAKKEGEIINLSDNVKINFVPMTSEIITLARGNVIYDDNEVIITVNQAKEIAKEYMPQSATTMQVKLDIVVPNYYWTEDNQIYKKINRSRKSYVITFDDKSETKVYIDCTTGEVIGGDSNI